MNTNISPSMTISPSETHATADSHNRVDSHNDGHDKNRVDSHNTAEITSLSAQNGPNPGMLSGVMGHVGGTRVPRLI